EMAAAAVAKGGASEVAGEHLVTELCDVACGDPLVLEGRRQVAVALFPSGRDGIRYEIHSASEPVLNHSFHQAQQRPCDCLAPRDDF
ncbi:MAG TPA: hypothetical protein VLB84_20175, partial [Bacteroidia bacterium]|nr:hypothetical protein [Bacteroidia bacterium]